MQVNPIKMELMYILHYILEYIDPPMAIPADLELYDFRTSTNLSGHDVYVRFDKVNRLVKYIQG